MGLGRMMIAGCVAALGVAQLHVVAAAACTIAKPAADAARKPIVKIIDRERYRIEWREPVRTAPNVPSRRIILQ